MRFGPILALAVLLAGSIAHADDATKSAKIARIVEAQGLQQMFQAQMDQGLVTAREVGREVVRRMAQEAGMSQADAAAKLEPVFQRYLERCATMFTAKELVDLWTDAYGRDLSERELDQILAYYRSPVGRKDVAASRSAMGGFTQAVNAIGKQRFDASLGQLIADLKTAMQK